MQSFRINHFYNVKYMGSNILEINLFQKFLYILIWKIDSRTNSYNKSNNQCLIMLIIKFEKHNNQHSYKW